MKFALAAALFAAVSAADCPASVKVSDFGADKTCDAGSLDADKTKVLQENWDFLAKTFSEKCYKVGDKYMKWTCTDDSITASVYKDEACSDPELVATDHPVKKEFVYGKCTQFAEGFITVEKA